MTADGTLTAAARGLGAHLAAALPQPAAGARRAARAEPAPPDTTVAAYHLATAAMVRGDRPDLTARQMAVLLTIYLGEGPHTVRGMAADLAISKPAVTRALDRLGDLDLTRRKIDPADRRSVLVQRTPKGAAYLREMRGILVAARAEAEAA